LRTALLPSRLADRDARRLTNRHQAGHDGIRVVLRRTEDLRLDSFQGRTQARPTCGLPKFMWPQSAYPALSILISIFAGHRRARFSNPIGVPCLPSRRQEGGPAPAVAPGRFQLTDRGRDVLASRPAAIDIAFLVSRFPEMSEFRWRPRVSRIRFDVSKL
jgi:hypothetical protein